MYESKYSNVLTVLLIIVIVAIIGVLGFGGYKVYKQITDENEAKEYVNSFIENAPQSTNTTNTDGSDNTIEIDRNEVLNQLNPTPSGGSGSGGSSISKPKPNYNGFSVIGTIEIPKINLSYPILEEATASAIEVSVAMIYGSGPNNPGNTTIIGHNYRNGKLFANNKKLSIGDKIYITDLNGKRLSYTIYDKYETTPDDTEFITRNTYGVREVSLQTCTDDASMRLIILAKCDADSKN